MNVTPPLKPGTHLGTLFVLWFGPLPSYFNAWCNSLQRSSGAIQWHLFTDQTAAQNYQGRHLTVSVISRLELAAASEKTFGSGLHIRTSAKNFYAKCCDYRLYLPLLFPSKTSADVDYWGWTDIDVLYGDVSVAAKAMSAGFGMISGAVERPCGPFTLWRKGLQQEYLQRESVLDKVSAVEHLVTDESPELVAFTKDHGFDVFPHPQKIQPGMHVMPYAKRCATLIENTLQVRVDGVWKDAVIFHFSRLLRPGFIASATFTDLQTDVSPVRADKYGIRALNSRPLCSSRNQRFKWWIKKKVRSGGNKASKNPK